MLALIKRRAWDEQKPREERTVKFATCFHTLLHFKWESLKDSAAKPVSRAIPSSTPDEPLIPEQLSSEATLQEPWCPF